MTSGREPFRSKNPMEVYKQIVSGHVDIPTYFSANLVDLINKLLNISKSKRLGRTMGGGGAVMQHRWYDGFDWDAHLKKKLKAPLQPKTDTIHRKESTVRGNLEIALAWTCHLTHYNILFGTLRELYCSNLKPLITLRTPRVHPRP